MKKKKNHITKEVGIILLLLTLIILMSAVALYDFIPTNINIPEPIKYAADSKTTSIKQEIAYTNGGDKTADESLTDEEEIVTSLKSYSIEASDLTVYGQKNLYNSGNSNPFDYAIEETAPTQTTEGATTNTDSTQSGNNTVTNSTGNNTVTSETTTTGTFFESSTSK